MEKRKDKTLAKSEENRRYLENLKSKGKYENFLAKRRGSRKRRQAKFRAEHPEEAREKDRIRRRKYLEKMKSEGGKRYKYYLEKRRKPARLKYHEKLGNVEDIGKYRKKLTARKKRYFDKLKKEDGGSGHKQLRERENKQRRDRLVKMKAEDSEAYEEYLKKNRSRAARRRKRLREEKFKKD